MAAGIENECQNLIEQIKDLENNINNENIKLRQIMDEYSNYLNEKVDEENKKGENEINSFLEDFEIKMKTFQNEFDRKMDELNLEHEKNLERIRNEGDTFENRIQIHYQKFDKESFLKMANEIIEENKKKLAIIKSKILNEIEIYSNNQISYQNEKIEFNKKIENEHKEMEKALENLKNNVNPFDNELSIKQKEMDELSQRFRNELNDRKAILDHDNQNDNSTLDYLRRSLKSSLDLLRKKIQKDEQKLLQINENMKKEIEEFIQTSKSEISKLNSDKTTNKMQNKRVIETNSKAFMMQKDKMKKEYEAEIKKLKELLSENENNGNKVLLEYQSKFENLKKEKDSLISLNLQTLSDFEQKLQNDINSIKDETIEKIEKLKNQISTMLQKDQAINEKKIEEIKAKNQEKEESLKKEKNMEYEQTLELIQSCGYSKSEYQKLENDYQILYNNLQDQLRENVVVVPESEIFKNMLRVISDLKAEKIDHETIIQSRTKCINFEWTEKIEKEKERFKQKTNINAVNPRAREQAKKAMMIKIENVKNEKQEKIIELTNILNNLQNETKFKNILDEFYRDNNFDEKTSETKLNEIILQLSHDLKNSIENAEIVKKDLIHNLKNTISNQINENNSQINEIKALINKQNSEFKEENKKLNENLSNIHQNSIQNEKDLKNSYAIILNDKKKAFNEIKSILQQEIKEFKPNFPQDTRNVWTMQRAELDASVYQLKNEINNELARLNQEKEQIRKSLDKKWQECFDRKSKINLINSNMPSRAVDTALIDKLEGVLKTVTIQLTNAINDMKKYKHIYIKQEKQINEKFGVHEIGIFQKKHANHMDNVV
ncbi:hypothetical protein TRFO_21567 [Tritrichomonas foetus]|uniref:Uncharacterized protein n=1 Tax=Tritrichomonas foetus TaxID=1144522 RepID=A0A1J4KF05_9EUKA|nr:hypothetical protein TRFO_21567 [Tritrichomonas foetus]|eukprot:OHT09520.1 hypothetical protein TRFO_21567 [Tritrichomonas foetus]